MDGEPIQQTTPQQALTRLLEGNRRFVDRSSAHSYADEAQSRELLEGQHPIATVFGCADSRVPVEVVFDQGFGDLFVIRNAGHIVGESVLASMEFAVSVIGVPLIVVLGHSQCGAATAAVKAVTGGTYPSGHLVSIVHAIEPVARITGSTNVDDVMRAHVVDTARKVYQASGTIGEAVRHGNVWVVAAEYELSTRRVNVLGILEPATI